MQQVCWLRAAGRSPGWRIAGPGAAMKSVALNALVVGRFVGAAGARARVAALGWWDWQVSTRCGLPLREIRGAKAVSHGVQPIRALPTSDAGQCTYDELHRREIVVHKDDCRLPDAVEGCKSFARAS